MEGTSPTTEAHAARRAEGPAALGATSEQVELIRFLAEGLTDEAIGKRIGVSSRTVRRRVAEIIDLLGARSRFQAGAKAAEAGWVAYTRPVRGRNPHAAA